MWFYYIQWKSMITNVYIVISVRCPNVAQHCCYQNSAVHCGGRSPERGCNACESINRTCRIANRGPASQTHKHTRILLNLLLAIYTSRLVLMAIINHRNYSREWCFGGVWPCTRWWCCCLHTVVAFARHPESEVSSFWNSKLNYWSDLYWMLNREIGFIHKFSYDRVFIEAKFVRFHNIKCVVTRTE